MGRICWLFGLNWECGDVCGIFYGIGRYVGEYRRFS